MINLHTENQPKIERNQSDKSRKSASRKKTSPSLVVRDGRKRTALSHGISPQERTTFDTATHFLEQQYGRKNVYVCVEFHHLNEALGREGIRKFKSDFAQLQRRAGYPGWYVEVLEAKGGVHSNLIGPLPVTYAKRLEDYSYGPQISVKRISDMPGLRNYLLKESTPQAVFGTGVRRDKGPHPLGEGGGDRVRLSTALRGELIDRGLLPDNLVRTYASRGLKKHLTPIPIADIEAVVAALPVPGAIAPVTPSASPSQPAQLSLALDDAPFDIRTAVEAKRIERGLTQAEAGALIGYRQPGYSNALIRRHDPLSPWARNRALAFLAVA